MTSSFLWSTFAASSLLIGGLLTFWFRISNKMLGLIMAFGSGVLISAVAFELAHESVELSTDIFSHGICPECAAKLYPECNPYKKNE